MAAIRTSGLTKRYGDLTAVADLDLEVREGEVFGFLGPNGAGKSTTINTLLDFTRPTEGSATVLGYDAQEQADRISPRVGVLPEGFDCYPRLTGRRHVEFAIETKDADDDPDELLERVGLDSKDRSRRAGEYSTGMRQRLATAMALVGDPDLLIMDEPSSGLDPHGIREMQELVRSEADSGTTVFFSSHILEHVDAVCDRIGVLNDGHLVAVDTIEGLRESVGSGATMMLNLADANQRARETVASIEGIAGTSISGQTLECSVANPAAKATVVTELARTGVTIHDIQIEEVSLESLFTTLTNGDSEQAQRSRIASENNTEPVAQNVDSEVAE